MKLFILVLLTVASAMARWEYISDDANVKDATSINKDNADVENNIAKRSANVYGPAITDKWCRSKQERAKNTCDGTRSDCFAKGKALCDQEPHCYGVMWHAGWSKERGGVMLCRGNTMDRKTDGWVTQMKRCTKGATNNPWSEACIPDDQIVMQKGAKPFSVKQSSDAKVTLYKMINEGKCTDTGAAPIDTTSECKTASNKLNLRISKKRKWQEVVRVSDGDGARPEGCWYSEFNWGLMMSRKKDVGNGVLNEREYGVEKLRWPLCKTAGDNGAWKAIDGDRKTCAKTSDTLKSWLEVDLGSTYTITGFSLARPSACPSFDIFVMNEECLSRSECKGKQLCKRQNDDAMYVSGTCDVSIVGSKIRMESIPENGKKKCSGGLEVCELAFTGSKKIAAKKDTPAKVGLTPDEFEQKVHLSKDEEKTAESKGIFDQAVEELSK